MKRARGVGEADAVESRSSAIQRAALPQVRSPEVLEHEVLRLQARIEELEREHVRLENFAAMAAHEVLKPLVMTEGYATVIGDRMNHALDLDSRRDLDAIVRISSRVRLLVEALLMDARDSRRPLPRQQVDLADVMRDCVRMLKGEIETRDFHLEIDPLPVVEGDPALLSGVFGNLLANALKYGPRAGGDIHVSAERGDAGWTFAVQSPGPALPRETRERIFEAWERGPSERRARGSGLGLAIVRHIVERHGGEVGVGPANGSGNRFFFTLPA